MDFDKSAAEKELGRPMTKGDEYIIKRAAMQGELSAPRESLINLSIDVFTSEALMWIILTDRQKAQVIKALASNEPN